MGFPKHAFTRDAAGALSQTTVDLAACYPALIDRVKRELQQINPDVGLIFNNVSNYPVHTTASADQEAIYMEVWAPYDRYGDLKALIDRAGSCPAASRLFWQLICAPSRSKKSCTLELDCDWYVIMNPIVSIVRFV
ncbi:glycoside hydrolase family 66 protein [Paenibacillus sp. GCM10027626]|uniref:glycoside hydrolase family 66 protein n=1 Tax=Paenibacillus sp. GCM10027626 TaxID=3273411 RepID=UPI003640D644